MYKCIHSYIHTYIYIYMYISNLNVLLVDVPQVTFLSKARTQIVKYILQKLQPDRRLKTVDDLCNYW